MTAANFLSNPQQPAPVLISSGGQSAGGQPSATNNETPTVLGWGFFLSDRAGSRVLMQVPANACGLRQPPELAVPGHIPLSPGHSSLRPRSQELARSPQRPQRRPIQIKGLRADESSGWIAVSGSKGTCIGCVLSVHIDNYRRNTTIFVAFAHQCRNPTA